MVGAALVLSSTMLTAETSEWVAAVVNDQPLTTTAHEVYATAT